MLSREEKQLISYLERFWPFDGLAASKYAEQSCEFRFLRYCNVERPKLFPYQFHRRDFV